MNLLKLLLSNGIYNAPVLQSIDENNGERLDLLLNDIETDLGYKINKDIIKILAVKRFLDCYSKDEIIYILDSFQMLRGGKPDD